MDFVRGGSAADPSGLGGSDRIRRGCSRIRRELADCPPRTFMKKSAADPPRTFKFSRKKGPPVFAADFVRRLSDFVRADFVRRVQCPPTGGLFICRSGRNFLVDGGLCPPRTSSASDFVRLGLCPPRNLSASDFVCLGQSQSPRTSFVDMNVCLEQ